MVSNGRFNPTFCTTPVDYWTDFFISPGRFFAINELKCLMGHILLDYDIKWSNRDFLEGGYTPANTALGILTRPNENTTIKFRRRIQI